MRFSSCLFLWWYEWFSDALYPSRQFILIYDQPTFLPTLLALSLTDWPTKFWIIKALTPSIVRKFVIQPWLFSQLSALLSACSLSRWFHELPHSIEFNKNLNLKNIQDKWTSTRIDLVGTFCVLVWYSMHLFYLNCCCKIEDNIS